MSIIGLSLLSTRAREEEYAKRDMRVLRILLLVTDESSKNLLLMECLTVIDKDDLLILNMKNQILFSIDGTYFAGHRG